MRFSDNQIFLFASAFGLNVLKVPLPLLGLKATTCEIVFHGSHMRSLMYTWDVSHEYMRRVPITQHMQGARNVKQENLGQQLIGQARVKQLHLNYSWVKVTFSIIITIFTEI